MPATVRVIGYCRVSSEEQGRDGVSLDAQEHAIRARAEAEGWQVVEVVREVGSGAAFARRPLVREVIARCEAGEADSLVVANLDRLTRSTIDAGRVFERVRKGRWDLVALDLGIDTRTSAGELVANVMVSVGQWQRRVIGERTSSALQERKRQGLRNGRPLVEGPEVDLARARIAALRKRGLSWRQVADALNEEGVPTFRGGARWYHTTAKKVHYSVVPLRIPKLVEARIRHLRRVGTSWRAMSWRAIAETLNGEGVPAPRGAECWTAKVVQRVHDTAPVKDHPTG